MNLRDRNTETVSRDKEKVEEVGCATHRNVGGGYVGQRGLNLKGMEGHCITASSQIKETSRGGGGNMIYHSLFSEEKNAASDSKEMEKMIHPRGKYVIQHLSGRGVHESC